MGIRGVFWLAAAISTASAQPVGLVTVSSAGVQGNGLNSNVAISRDGRHVFYSSRSTTLVLAPVTSGQQLFAHDRDPDGNGVFDEGNGVTTLMSIGVNGQPGDQQTGGFNGFFSIDCSADGRFVVWQSQSQNLIPNDGTGRPFYDVFVRDRDPDGNGVLDEGNGLTERVNSAVGGGDANSSDNGADEVGMSDDGRWVVYSSSSRNIAPFDVAFGGPGIYLHDRNSSTTSVLVPTEVNIGFRDPQISADGQWVTYAGGDRFVPNVGSTNDVWVIRRTGGASVRISKNDNGDPADQDSGLNPNSKGARLSADGRYVVFTSSASNLDVTRPNDLPGSQKLFIHDRDSDGNTVFDEPSGFTTRRVDVGLNGIGSFGFPADPDVSDDGSRVVFYSYATDIDPTDALLGTFNGYDVFVRETASGSARIVSRDAAGTQATGPSFLPKISGNGRQVIFGSSATDLVPGDMNGRDDYFVKTLRCNGADFAPPFGTLSQADVSAFVNAFFAGSPDAAALAPPFDVVSQADVTEFVRLFFAGCPS